MAVGLMLAPGTSHSSVASAGAFPRPRNSARFKHLNDPVQAWAKLKYGAFVHYNIQQYEPKEDRGDYYRGDCLNPGSFNPTKLDIKGWVRSFKEAGMGYAVLTARHVGGFLLWDSETTTYNSMHSPVRRDIVAEFLRECREQGLVPGIYYLMGGGKHDPFSCPVKGERFGKQALLAQLTELTTKYGEIPYFWIDMMDWRDESVSVREVYDLIKLNQPSTVIQMNQHGADGERIHYFPADVINGEETIPTAKGYDPVHNVLTQEPRTPYDAETDQNSGYEPNRFYLPFEYSLTSQVLTRGERTTSLGYFRDTVWFTRATTRPEKAKNVYVLAKQAYDRGASNVLLAAAPDATGAMRVEDVEQLKILGNLIHAGASTSLNEGSMVTRVKTLGARVTQGRHSVGCRIKVGKQPLMVRSLGRFRSMGDHMKHFVEIREMGGKILADAEVSMRNESPDINGFIYEIPDKPVWLEAGQSYDLLSDERGDDSYYGDSDLQPSLLHDGKVEIEGPVIDGNFEERPGHCYGPLNMTYSAVSSTPSTEPVAHWSFTNPKQFSDLRNQEDWSGNGNTAIARSEGALQYYTVENSATLNIRGNITFAATIVPKKADGVQNILAHGYTVVPPREVFLRINNGFYEAGIWEGTSDPLVRVSWPVPNEDWGKIVKIAGVFSEGAWKLYRNGKFVALRSVGTSPIEGGKSPKSIVSLGAPEITADWGIGACARGRCGLGETRMFRGSILDVQIYDRALSPEELEKLTLW
jgi:hypothetical protein